MDYEKLAIAIINTWESDRKESGRTEIVKGVKYLLDNYKTEDELNIIDDVFISLVGYKLSTLEFLSKEIKDEELEE